MADDIIFRLGIQDAKAVEGFLRLTKEEKKLQNQAIKTTNALAKQDRQLNKVKKQSAAVGATFKKHSSSMGHSGSALKKWLGIALGATGLMAVARLLTTIDTKMSGLATKTNDLATAELNLALQQEPGAVSSTLKFFRHTGAKFGLTMGESAETGQVIQAIYSGNLQAAKPAFIVAAQLQEAGVSQADATTIVNVARARELTADVFASQLLRAGFGSALNPAQMAQVAPFLGQFKKASTGLAAASALSAYGIKPQQIPVLVEKFALATSGVSSEKFRKGLGIAEGTSPEEQVRMLRAAAEASGDAQQFLTVANLMRLGMTELRQAKSISFIVGQSTKFLEEQIKIEEQGGGLVPEAILRAREDPQQAAALDTRRAAALATVAEFEGIDAQYARDRLAREQKFVTRTRDRDFAGRSFIVDPNTGGFTKTGRVILNTFADIETGKLNAIGRFYKFIDEWPSEVQNILTTMANFRMPTDPSLLTLGAPGTSEAQTLLEKIEENTRPVKDIARGQPIAINRNLQAEDT